MCATSGRSHSVLSSYFHLCLLCFLVCVHHGHQAENLSKDISKIGNDEFLDGNADLRLIDKGIDDVVTAKLVSQDSGADLRNPQRISPDDPRDDNEHVHDHRDDNEHVNDHRDDNEHVHDHDVDHDHDHDGDHHHAERKIQDFNTGVVVDQAKIDECKTILGPDANRQIHSGEEDYVDESLPITDYRLWLAAVTAILVISLCGVFGVLVIPIMQKVFYQHLIQFLVALAIGSMLGDAFLHLIPHALAPRSSGHSHGGGGHHSAEDENSHTVHVWSGFVALTTLVLFFLAEKMINMLGEWRERRRAMHREKKVRVVRSGHKASSRAVGERLCKHKYSAYCVADIDEVTPETFSTPIDEDQKQEANQEQELTPVAVSSHSPLLLPKSDDDGSNCIKQNETFSISQTVPKVSFVKPGEHQLLPAISDSCLLDKKRETLLRESGDSQTNKTCQNWWKPEPTSDGLIEEPDSSQYDTVFIREHEIVHHGHSHAHSHLHSAPDSITSVAWMVIVGDGIHNLADGLAVGAAFTESFMSGLSTSIAVLCHELPHEVGDFAMLLKAGMSVKQAIFYNILSSVLAFVGMVIGVLLGNLENLTPWIFMGTAGIFMYVALVDMIPELNSGHAHPYTSHEQHEARSTELGLQILGMSTGISIMLLIALYEHDLKEAFVGLQGH